MPRGRNDQHSDYIEVRDVCRRNKYSRIGLIVTILPGILLGGYIGKKLAHFLEICNLFTPDIVDDD
ncbi:essential MCU regulator, mitochondrial [Drosophila bipectinata]|uniref:essential MCU regulator, mitochondrial n=1 Tax=Drosophila bipectinata TaxID=42026 RepID=UPI001C8A69F7|nr:essential MCU regulator, mitochondrial [Drosophila bipectinata]KAH8244357.1 hypothetical protein KR026_007494 [Drosophila bipectinata]KAH8329534.1 hypothetical protein KR074_012558 [Drosophila pseudoananassae]